MTTSRPPFVPFRVPSLDLGFALTLVSLLGASPAFCQSGAPAPGLQGQVVWLPAEPAPPLHGPLERLDGRHISWEFDEVSVPKLGLGTPIPQRALVALIERRIDSRAPREQAVSVETLGPILLLRGGTGTPPDALQSAADTANGTIREFQALADGLRFRTRVRLLKGDEPVDTGGTQHETVFDTTQVLTSGERGAFGASRTRPMVSDFEVEVASSISIADPSLAFVHTGETVHLWASTRLTPQGGRELYVQGLLDIAVEASARHFDPDVYELGSMEQPMVLATQVLFAGTLPMDGPLVVTVDGLTETVGSRRLEITAEAIVAPAEATSAPSTERVVDLARGMWRSNISLPHALGDGNLPVVLQDPRMPASGAQLVALMFSREASQRPDIGSSLLILPTAARKNHGPIQELFRNIDPSGNNTVLRVASTRDDFRVSLPAARGSLLRVARTRETIFVVDYNPQIANDASLADPRAEIFMTGEVLECTLESTPTGMRLQGSVRSETLESVTIREVDPPDVGRIQHPVVRSQAERVTIQPGEETSTAGFLLRLN